MPSTAVTEIKVQTPAGCKSSVGHFSVLEFSWGPACYPWSKHCKLGQSGYFTKCRKYTGHKLLKGPQPCSAGNGIAQHPSASGGVTSIPCCWSLCNGSLHQKHSGMLKENFPGSGMHCQAPGVISLAAGFSVSCRCEESWKRSP